MVSTRNCHRFLEEYSEFMPDTISHFEGRYLSLREIDDWEFATRPNSTAVVGILAMTPENEVILVEQFRRPVQARVLEMCAGLVGDEPEFAGESLVDAARRELLSLRVYHAPPLIADLGRYDRRNNPPLLRRKRHQIRPRWRSWRRGHHDPPRSLQ